MTGWKGLLSPIFGRAGNDGRAGGDEGVIGNDTAVLPPAISISTAAIGISLPIREFMREAATADPFKPHSRDRLGAKYTSTET
jgi:hypothetical protein